MSRTGGEAVVRWGAGLLLMALAFGGAARGQDAAPAPVPLQYRRIFWPSDRLEQLGGRYLPMRRAEFDQRIDRHQGPPEASVPGQLPRIHWQATVDPGAGLHGTGYVEFPLPMAWVTIPIPAGMAVFGLTEEALDSPPAGGFDSQGRLRIRVDQPGRFRWRWSATSQEGNSRRQRYSFSPPPGWWNVWQLEAPAGWELRPQSPLVALPPDERPPDDAADQPHRVHWITRPEMPLVFDLQRQQAVGGGEPVQQETQHRLSPAGLTTVTRWQLPADIPLTDGLVVRVPPGMTVTHVQVGGQAGPWLQQDDRLTVFTAGRGPAESSDTAGDRWVVEVKGEADWPLGQSLPLPRLQLEGVTAVEHAVVRLEPGLTVRDLSVPGGNYLGPEEADQPLHRFRFDEPSDRAMLTADWQEAHLTVASGTSVQLNPSLARARILADITADRGACFALRLRLLGDWTASNVSSVSAEERVAQWREVAQGNERWLEIRLRDAVSPVRPLRLAIQLQLRGRFLATDPPLQLAQLRPVQWEPSVNLVEWYSFRASYPYRLVAVEPVGADWLSVEDMSTQQLQLLSAQPGDWLMEGTTQNLAFSLRLTQEQPRLTARTQVQVSLHRDQRLHRYRVELEPGSASSVRRVSFDIFPAGTEDLRWQIDRPGSTNLLVRRLAGDQVPPGVERWEIELPEAVREPFTVIAERTVRGTGGARIPLLRVNGAAEQSATVLIGVIDPLPIRIIQNGPLESMAVDPASTVRYRRQYAYPADQIEGIDLRVALDGSAPPPGIYPMWIWLARIETELSRSGRSRQRVHLYAENHGASQLALQVAPTALIRRMSVNGREARWSEEGGEVVIGVPREERFLDILAEMQLEGLPLPTLGRLLLTAPDIDVPVLKWQWVHWLPPGYAERPRGWSVHQAAPFAAPSSDVRPLLDPLVAARPPAHDRPAAPPGRVGASEDPYDAQLLAANGWTPVAQQTMDRSAELSVYRPLPFRVLAAVVFLCVVGVHATFLRTRPRITASVTLGAAAAWLVLPVPFSSFAAAVALALGLAALLAATSSRSLPPPVEPSSARGTSSRRAATAASLMALAALWGAARAAVAVELPDGDPNVLIPVDADGRPVGEFVYLPKAFYDRLLVRGADPAAPPAWIIKRAQYRVEAESADLAAADGLLPVIARWELTTLRSEVQVPLPLPSSLVRQLRTDGRTTPWTGDARAIRVGLETLGDHLVEAELQVPWGTVGLRRTARLPLPPVPDAQLIAEWPLSGGRLEVAPMAAPPTWSNDRTLLEVRLPRSDRLTLEWQPDSGVNQTTVDQSLWLQADRQRIVLTARFRVRSSAPQPPETLTLTTDRPLTATGPGAPQEGATAQRQFQVPLRRGLDGELRGQVQWTVEHTGGWFRIPAIAWGEGQRGESYLAMSMTSGLTYQADWLRVAEPAEISLFEQVWGPLAAPPDTVLPWPQAAQGGSVLLRWPAQAPTVTSLLQYVVDAQRMDVWLEAVVEPQGTASHQLRVRVPPDWTPQRVDAFHNGQPIELTWSRSAPDRLNLFFYEVPVDPFVVLVKGRLATVLQKPLVLPRLSIDGCIAKSCELRLFSRPETLATVIRQDGFQKRTEEGDEWLTPVDNQARLVADLITSQEDAEAEVTVVPNRPVSDHDLVLQVRADPDGRWRGVLSHHVQVRQGELRQVRYEVPADWIGQMELPEDMKVHVRPSLHPDRIQLLVELDQPVLQEASWEWEVPLEVSAVGSVRIPLIQLGVEGPARGRVEVPARIGNRPIRWVGRGVEEREGSDEEPLEPGTRRFEVVDVPYALTGNIEAPTAEAQIYMEDIYFQWMDAQGAIAWMAYDFHSGSSATCQVRLPESASLVQISLDNQPALAELRGKSRWEVALGATRYPQRLTMIVKYAAPQHAGIQRIGLPELRFGGQGRAVARQRLVTVASPGGAGPAMGSASLQGSTMEALGAMRRAHLEELIHSNWPTAGTGRQTPELAAWQARLQEVIAAQEPGAPARRPWLGGGSDRWQWIVGADVRYTCLVAPASSREVTLHYPRDSGGTGRWLLCIVGLAAAAWLARPSCWQRIEPQLSRWLPAGIVVAGLVLSQTVWPGFLGWILVAGGVWVAVLPLWMGRARWV